MSSPSPHTTDRAIAKLKSRRRADTVFHAAGVGAIVFAVAALVWLLASIVGTGASAFSQNVITFDAVLDEAALDPDGARDPDALRLANYRAVVQQAMYERFDIGEDRGDRRDVFGIVSASGATDIIRQQVYNDPSLVGQTISVTAPVSDDVDQYLKGNLTTDIDESLRRVSDKQIEWVQELRESGEVRSQFNWTLFTSPDSRDPELAGVASAVVGSVLTMFVTFLLAFPLGVGAAVYLEEYAPKNAFTDFVEININNLAAVPSIVFGLLGLAVFLNFFGMPRSAPLVGGIVLAFMTFPTIMIATRAALKAVPSGIFDGALSLGASHTQAVFHHKLPNAAPGILTGSIIGMARALGETAPLLMIGMVAFVTEIPSSITEPSSALPVQIFLWSDSAEVAWEERTSAAILILLVFMIAINGAAIWLRSRLEKRW